MSLPVHMKPRANTPKAVYERARRAERWQFIQEYLLDHPCKDCGMVDPTVLDFHHVRGVKKLALCRMVSAGYGVKTLLKEIAKCVVLCANCHRRETAKQQGWKRFNLSQQGG